MGEAEDAAYAAGSGADQPQGLALAANVARVPAGQKLAASVSATPTLADLLSLPWKLPAKYRTDATWLFSEDAAPKIQAITWANGDSICPRLGAGEGPFGWPARVVPGLPSMATAGTTDPSVWFINVGMCYRVVDRQRITVQRLTQRYAELGLVGLLCRSRVGGDMVRPDAAVVYTL
jgi:HK97 family phage major capsid protein